ncbi:YnfA family protein [Brevundimonas sp. M20]|uniref:YnfA family protein n=1 Tax=Brevundimonas sp. M20 TaxID=2591463 RepID=UPI001147546B|nr:YnfA family protein [Brevundimonas sp. M20]QDH72624.1 YnfA family protein [Brevundimonas sp. M20]
MKLVLIYPLAALAEIAGCFAFWAWLKLDRSPLWLVPGVACLIAFACLLTLVPTDAAGRAFAVYGGVYICASLAWMALVEKSPPDRWDLIGGAVCLIGAGIILFAPRG